jgi:hypothetical protein
MSGSAPGTGRRFRRRRREEAVREDDLVLVSVDDPFSSIPRADCTVGARRERAEGHDVSLVARGVPEHRRTTHGDFVAAATPR